MTDNISSTEIKVSLKGACSSCAGYIKNCRDCGQKIEILNGKPLDYHVGSYHNCPRRPRY